MIRLLAGCLLMAAPAMAQEALYGAQPPAGSAYVRFANATQAVVDVSSTALPTQTLTTTESGRITPYAVVEKVAGRKLAVTLRSGGRSVTADIGLTPDGFATILVRPTADGSIAATVAADGAEFNQARARLSFYNATPSCGGGSLSLVPAGTAVFADVAPGSSKSRNVNPVTATIRASCTGASALDLALSGMEVGKSYSVWLMQPTGMPVSFVSLDRTLPYKR